MLRTLSIAGKKEIPKRVKTSSSGSNILLRLHTQTSATPDPSLLRAREKRVAPVTVTRLLRASVLPLNTIPILRRIHMAGTLWEAASKTVESTTINGPLQAQNINSISLTLRCVNGMALLPFEV